MKLIHFLYNNKENMGILEDSLIKVLDVTNFYELIEKYSIDDLYKIKGSIKDIIKEDDIIPLAFINKPKEDIICAGMNYYSHKDECVKEGVDTTDFASVYFSKRARNVITTSDFIDLHKDITDECDYEGELGVILSKDLYKPKSTKEIEDSIFGYVIINDVSARNLQRSHKQYYFAKSLETYSVMSHVLVTIDEIGIEPKLSIKTYINDELRQNDNTSNMIFSIEYMLKELSSGILLDKGTILSTGTPNGVGMGLNPKKFLNPSDKVRIEIKKIGVLENICK